MPQTNRTEDSSITDGLRIIRYAPGSSGRIDPVSDDVWQPVQIANRQAWKEIEQAVERSRQKVLSGQASCLHYYMTLNQMGVRLLARSIGLPAWQVRLHLFPRVFRRLPERILDRYAEFFRISRQDLVRGNLRGPDPGMEGVGDD